MKKKGVQIKKKIRKPINKWAKQNKTNMSIYAHFAIQKFQKSFIKKNIKLWIKDSDKTKGEIREENLIILKAIFKKTNKNQLHKKKLNSKNAMIEIKIKTSTKEADVVEEEVGVEAKKIMVATEGKEEVGVVLAVVKHLETMMMI